MKTFDRTFRRSQRMFASFWFLMAVENHILSFINFEKIFALQTVAFLKTVKISEAPEDPISGPPGPHRTSSTGGTAEGEAVR